MKKESIIEIKELTKDYGHGRGVFDFSFYVKRGEIFGLVGTNGSGKTTTIRNMMGFLHPDKGQVTIAGLDAWKEAAQLKTKIGYIPGQIDFPDVGSGTAFLKLQAEFIGLKDLRYMNELIDRFKIDISAPLRRMSKGMKQKMAIVAAFMAQPDIYLLDEPSTGLDPLMRDELIAVVLEQKKLGKTVFMSSHIFKELEDTCDTVMFIRDGKMINTVRRSDFTSDPHEMFTIRFVSQNECERFLRSKCSYGKVTATDMLVHKSKHKPRITLNIPMEWINEFLRDLSRYSVTAFSNEQYTLEKYYTNIIEHQEVK